MSLEDVIIPKDWKDGLVLFAKTFNNIKSVTEEGFANVNLNFQQFARDVFTAGYQFDNDGMSNKGLSLEDRINILSSGGAPVSGTSNPTWSFNTGGFTPTLDASLLTTNHTYKLPDIENSTFLVNTGDQDLIGGITLYVPGDSTAVFFGGRSNGYVNIELFNFASSILDIVISGTANDWLHYNDPGDGIILGNSGKTLRLGSSSFTGCPVLSLSGPDNGVNSIKLVSKATGSDPELSAIGDDANIGMLFTPKGTGKIKLQNAITSYVDKGNSGAGTVTFDWSAGNTQKVTATGNFTIAFSNPGNFQKFSLIIKQDGTGSRTVTWPVTVRWLNGTGATNSTTDKPTLTTTANKFDVISFYYDSDLALYIGSVSGFKGAIT